MIILDTDCLSLLDWEQTLYSSNLRRQLDKFPSDSIFTTIISFEEQMRGWLAFISKCKTIDRQIYEYERFHRSLETYRDSQVLDFDQKAADMFKKLKTDKVRIGTMDLKIASIALANDAILVSRNLSDFEQVPSLRVQDWT